MMRWLHRRVLLPAFEVGWHRRGTFRYLRELEESQWRSPEEIRERQLVSLRKLLEHAAANCPYYTAEWNRLGLDASAVQSLDEFERWPLIDRDVIRANRLTMRSQRPGYKLISKGTGGSSGAPLQFDLDSESNDRRMAASHRGYGWAGAEIGTKQFHLWGGMVGKSRWSERFKDALYHQLYRRTMVSSFAMSDDRVVDYLRRLDRCRPNTIVAYTNPLYHFARVLAERKLMPFSPGSIIVGAEKLHDFQRVLIENVFRAPVFETYGSREFMLIGAECPEHTGLHLTMENQVIEILDDNGQPTPAGHEGNVVVTDLTNFGMPFVRYLNGDRAVAGFDLCRCRRGLPLLKQVVGRRLDTLRTPDGRLIPGEFFPHLLKDYQIVRRFQVIQHALDNVELKIVAGGPWENSARQGLIDEVQAVLGEAVHFQINDVNEIPLTSTGKLRVVVSHCSPEEATAGV